MKVDKFISHRGNNIDFIKNTIESFKEAKDYGFRWFETDVQMSVDGVLFLFHDKTAQRLTDCTKNVTQMTIAELQKLELVHPITGKKSKILTLKDYLDWAKESDVFTNLEFKITNTCFKYKTDLVFATLKLLSEYPDQKDKILVSSFSNVIMNILEQDHIYHKGKLFEISDWDKDFEYLSTEIYKDFVKNEYVALIINYE